MQQQIRFGVTEKGNGRGEKQILRCPKDDNLKRVNCGPVFQHGLSGCVRG